MLNISNVNVNHKVDRKLFPTLREVEARESGRVFLKVMFGLFLLGLVIMFIPWTQNIRGGGNVTTVRPDQRPQIIHSLIPGRVEKWFVQEGDFIHAGDTILFISEIKDDYFDPELLGRTQQQLKAKEMSVESYMEKVKALDTQIDALVETGKLKLEQADNKLKQSYLKVQSDSIEYEAAKVDFQIAQQQYDRVSSLFEQGLKSRTEMEDKNLKLQKAQADMISKESKLLTSENEVINAKVEITSIRAQYRDDVAKAESEKFTALSNMYDAEATVTKLQNQYMNYSVRTGFYYITAPQTGYVTQAIQTGIGETIKEGDDLVSIMPAEYDLAVEMYIRPIDLPLMNLGQEVRIQFDGWPAIIFSGWPNTSIGTYGGRVFAIDNFISQNGKYRLMVAPDPNQEPWPDALRVGAGTKNMVLLEDVPIWYELWRQINGFPPDYYDPQNGGSKMTEGSNAKQEKK